MALSPPDATIDAAAICTAQLRAICAAAGLAEQQDRIADLFTGLCDVAGLGRVPARPRWSGVTDDCTPIEFSTSFDANGVRVRFLIEAQDDPASAATYWAAGERLSAHLAATHNVVLEPMSAIGDLFAPADPNVLVAIWHSLEFRQDGSPLCKVYLNPAARGRDSARSLVVAALDRLGFGRASRTLLELLRDGDVITHLALDLVAADEARVKVYARHFRATPADLDRRADAVGADAGLDFTEVCDLICPGADVLSQRPVMTCYHLTAADPSAPAAMTLYLPLFPYASTDRIASERIAALLSRAGFDDMAYRRIADDLIATRTAGGDSLHTYIAYKRGAGGSRKDQATAYFNPSLFQPRYGRLALDPDRFWPSALG